MKIYTHDDLVELARRWLITRGCNVVITEMASNAGQEPDAIGWLGSGYSILIECKTSRADFFSDRNKGCNRADYSMGAYRFYLAPHGMIDVSDLPGGWGLLAPRGRRVAKQAESNYFENYKEDRELNILLSAMRRLKFKDQPGIRVRQYQIIGKSANRATVGIRAEEGIAEIEKGNKK